MLNVLGADVPYPFEFSPGSLPNTYGERTARAIRDAGNEAIFHPTDVSDEEPWAAAVDVVRSAYGPVSALVSDAYAVRVAPAHDTTLDQWNQQLGVTLTGAFLGFRACLDDQRATRGSAVRTWKRRAKETRSGDHRHGTPSVPAGAGGYRDRIPAPDGARQDASGQPLSP
ncbi:SDR family NAD(P)-dependent oxidoreductase [Streptomyces lividans]